MPWEKQTTTSDLQGLFNFSVMLKAARFSSKAG
jgi:hypothetical protein